MDSPPGSVALLLLLHWGLFRPTTLKKRSRPKYSLVINCLPGFLWRKEGRSRLLFSRLLHLEHSGFFFFFFINLIISPGFDFPVPHYTTVNLHIDWIWEYNLKLSSYFAPNIILLIFEWTGAIFKRAVEEKKKTTQKNQTTKLNSPTLLRLFSQNRSGIRDYDFCKKKKKKSNQWPLDC